MPEIRTAADGSPENPPPGPGLDSTSFARNNKRLTMPSGAENSGKFIFRGPKRGTCPVSRFWNSFQSLDKQVEPDGKKVAEYFGILSADYLAFRFLDSVCINCISLSRLLGGNGTLFYCLSPFASCTTKWQSNHIVGRTCHLTENQTRKKENATPDLTCKKRLFHIRPSVFVASVERHAYRKNRATLTPKFR